MAKLLVKQVRSKINCPQTQKRGLEALGLRRFGPEIISCPTCGRCEVDLVNIVQDLEKKLAQVSFSKSAPPLKVAVMGCVVNGPGESKHANLGISLPGTFEEPKAPVYVDGKLLKTLHGDTIVAEYKQILDKYVESHYGQ